MTVRLFDHCSGNGLAAAVFMPLKKIFKDAGDIRNIHIGIGILEKYQLNSSKATRHKEKQMAREIRDFAGRQVDHVKIIEEVENALMSMASDLDEQTVLAYIDGMLEKTGRKLRFIENKEDIHKARSIMKQVMYLNDMAGKRIRHGLSLDKSYVNALQETIGAWHDADLALEELQSQEGISKKVIRSVEAGVEELGRQVVVSATDFTERMHAYA
jgi:CHAD domain-containing protein